MSFSSFDNRLFSSSVFVISKKIKWHQNLRFCFLTCPMTACPTDIRIFYIYHGLLSIHIYLRVKRINNRLTPDVLGSILKNLFLCSFARHHSFCLFLCFYPISTSYKISLQTGYSLTKSHTKNLTKILQSKRLLFNKTISSAFFCCC